MATTQVDRIDPSVSPTTVPQLNFYNGALRICKQTQLQTLTDAVEARYLLDGEWNDGVGFVEAMLEQGLWNFALRTSMFTYDPTLTPSFGYKYAYAKPSDCVRTAMMAQDEYFNLPLTQYRDETGYWFAWLQQIYVSYVSNGADYGNNYALWPQTFIKAGEGYLASKIIGKLTGDEKEIDRVEKLAKMLLTDARSKAALNEATGFLPPGTWLRARWGNQAGNYDRGNPGQLYG